MELNDMLCVLFVLFVVWDVLEDFVLLWVSFDYCELFVKFVYGEFVLMIMVLFGLLCVCYDVCVYVVVE